MRKVTIKGLLAHKLRLALTALAIVLGVTFISGTFVLTDTLQNTFTVLFGNIFALPTEEAELLALRKEVFDTIDEVFAAGWRVD